MPEMGDRGSEPSSDPLPKTEHKGSGDIFAVVDELAGIRLPVAVDDETVSVKKKPMKLLSLAVHKKDTLRKRRRLFYPPISPM